MSAYIVSPTDITLLVNALHHYGVVQDHQPTTLGQLLWEENVRSVNTRYDDNEACETYCHLSNTIAGLDEPAFVLKQVRHYRYQSCEHDTWEESEAYYLMHLLEQALCRILKQDPEAVVKTSAYDNAPWGL